MKFVLKVAFIIILIILFVFISSYFTVSSHSNKFLYSDIDKLSNNKVGLILGTSIKTKAGTPNLFFQKRIQTAVDLFNNDKVQFLLVSGDNSTTYYNEPEVMKKELIKLGIPEDKIYADYAGFSTLDSILRANKVFGQNSFTVISQKFHNQRAVYIGRKHNIDIIGYNIPLSSYLKNYPIYLREITARVKAVIEVSILKKDPKFLGAPIQIN